MCSGQQISQSERSRGELVSNMGQRLCWKRGQVQVMVSHGDAIYRTLIFLRPGNSQGGGGRCRGVKQCLLSALPILPLSRNKYFLVLEVTLGLLEAFINCYNLDILPSGNSKSIDFCPAKLII